MTYPCAQAGRERAEAERAGGRKGTVVAYGGEGGSPPEDKEETLKGAGLWGGRKVQPQYCKAKSREMAKWRETTLDPEILNWRTDTWNWVSYVGEGK